MPSSKNIVSLLIVFLMLGSGLPLLNPGDVSRDGCTDLQDAILSIRDLALAAERPGALTEDLARVVTTLTTVAGLKSAIKPAQDSGSANTIQFLDTPYLKNTSEQPLLTTWWSGVDTRTDTFDSMAYKPVLPPPEIS